MQYSIHQYKDTVNSTNMFRKVIKDLFMTDLFRIKYGCITSTNLTFLQTQAKIEFHNVRNFVKERFQFTNICCEKMRKLRQNKEAS